MNHDTFTWNQKGETLFGQYWEADNAKAVIALVHGMGEHSSRYGEHFVPFFNKNGFHVIAFDHFGHGKTTGKRGHCPGYEAVLDSVKKLLEEAKERYAGLPVFLYGHSMGGNVLSNYLLKRQPEVAGAVISAPMLKLAFSPPGWKMAAGKWLINIFPGFTEKTGLDASAISRDKKEVEKYKNDPLVHDKITAAFSIPFFAAGDWAIDNANKLKTPSLVIHGTGDQLTSHKGSEAFAKNAKGKATLKLYEGAYHELHKDINKEDVLSDVLKWLNEHV